MTWRPKENLEISVGVQNAFDPQHLEFNSGFFQNQATEIPRSIYGQLVFRF